MGKGLRFKRYKDARNWQCIFWQNPHKGRKTLRKEKRKYTYILKYVPIKKIHASKAMSKKLISFKTRKA